MIDLSIYYKEISETFEAKQKHLNELRQQIITESEQLVYLQGKRDVVVELINDINKHQAEINASLQQNKESTEFVPAETVK